MTTALIITQSISILVIAVLLIWRQARTKIIRRQDQDMLKLNLHIQEQNEFIGDLIGKRQTKDKHTFRQRLEDMSKKQNLEKWKQLYIKP